MILTFNPQFVEGILNRSKIHTIRTDSKRRWRAGVKVQFWKGNPRNVKSNSYQFGYGICTDAESITLNFSNDSILFVDKVIIQDFDKLDEFAKHDGFENWDCMKDWFYDNYKDCNEFQMRLVHFYFLNSGKQP